MAKPKPDFKKRTAKLGKQAAKPSSYTDTTVKFRRVAVAQQSVSRDKSGQYLSERMQTAETLAAQSRAASAAVRREATSQLAQMVRKHGPAFVQAKSKEIVDAATNSIFAEEQDVRNEARTLFQQAVEKNAEAMVRHSALVTLKLKLALKEGRTPIKRDILRLLQSPVNILVGVEIVIPVSECLQEPSLVDDACKCISEISVRSLAQEPQRESQMAGKELKPWRDVASAETSMKGSTAAGWSTTGAFLPPTPGFVTQFLSSEELLSVPAVVREATGPADVLRMLLDRICEYGIEKPLDPQASANCFVLVHAVFSYIQASPVLNLLGEDRLRQSEEFPGLMQLLRAFPLRNLRVLLDTDEAAAPQLGHPVCAGGPSKDSCGTPGQAARASGEQYVTACNMMLFCVFCWAEMLPELELYLCAKEERASSRPGAKCFFDIERLVGILHSVRRAKARELGEGDSSDSSESEDRESGLSDSGPSDYSGNGDRRERDGQSEWDSELQDLDLQGYQHVFLCARDILRRLGALLGSRGAKQFKGVSSAFLGCLVRYFSNLIDPSESAVTEERDDHGQAGEPEPSASRSNASQDEVLVDLRGALRPLRPPEHLEVLVSVCRACADSRSPTLAALLAQELCMHGSAATVPSVELLGHLQAELFRTLPVMRLAERDRLCSRVGQALILACSDPGKKGMGALLPVLAEEPGARPLLLASAGMVGVRPKLLELLGDGEAYGE